MKAVLQRVNTANVYADGDFCSKIDAGLFVLLGVEAEDTELDADLLAAKIVKMRIFSDDAGKMNLSLLDVKGEILVVSNFTLNANYAHGNRPDYFAGASPDTANRLYEYFIEKIRELNGSCMGGRFGADMKCDVSLNGPVTIVMNSNVLKKGKNSGRKD